MPTQPRWRRRCKNMWKLAIRKWHIRSNPLQIYAFHFLWISSVKPFPTHCEWSWSTVWSKNRSPWRCPRLWCRERLQHQAVDVSACTPLPLLLIPIINPSSLMSPLGFLDLPPRGPLTRLTQLRKQTFFPPRSSIIVQSAPWEICTLYTDVSE